MNYFSLTKPKPSSLPSPEIQRFISSIEKFKKNEIPVEISGALKKH